MEKEKKIITLGNRYGAKNYLEEIGDNKYALRFSDPKEGEWCRVGLAEGYSWEDHEYYFVDPSGGPFLNVGRELTDDLAIKRIYLEENAYCIETEKIKKENV